MKTRTEIRIETHEKRIIRVNRQQTQAAFCGACGAKVMYLSVSQAAAVLSFSETAIFRLAESGKIHSIENPDGSLMVCGDSLLTVLNEFWTNATKTELVEE